MTRLARWLRWLLAALALGVAGVWWAARPAEPDAFYVPPAGASSEPGRLIRQDVFSRRLPAGAQGWRILYATTRADGVSAWASAIVLVSSTAPPGPRPVVAWTHGTTGVVPGCAPSVLDDPFANVPALDALLDAGWIYVATDYVGQGTAGPHPYLIGEGQARSALDAVRAARRMSGLAVGDTTVVWGHSQGGHAALWTGILAPTYAPDVPLAGVAALAPASDLRALVEQAQHTPVGRILSAFIVRAYSQAYPDVKPDEVAAGPVADMLARDMAGRCLAGPRALVSVAESMLLGGTIFGASALDGALGSRLAQNTPDRPLAQPLLLAQGMADDLVRPGIQDDFVHRRCRGGQPLDYRRYGGRDHLSLVAVDSPLTTDLMSWTRDRLAGLPVPTGCRDATN